MGAVEVRVISIGALGPGAGRGRAEADGTGGAPAGRAGGGGRRPGHATTTLVTSGARRILIDPGLPEPVLLARLEERAGLAAREITHVFLTSFKPDVRRGLGAFEEATWWIGEGEREGMGVPLVRALREAEEAGDEELAAPLREDVAILKRCAAAPDRLADRVDLFPLPGVTPGLCGVLIAGPAAGVGPGTTVVCGDAIATLDHLQRGRVLLPAADVARAQESFQEAMEIADVLVLGRDNVVVNPGRR
ncbi:MAG TPA: MBL fold metallo-hydrolase [Phycisphaerales bacterium]|nr:MBL fold metallo-hydrolase [Phycisphaerales bacterium]